MSGSVLTIAGVFVGRPVPLGRHGGRAVSSGIVKHLVADDELTLGPENLDGDEQADLSMHGGPEKAVYVYPREHYPAWAGDGFSLDPGTVGENVSVLGADESAVRVGERWAWGAAEVQVCQPRAPCFKLGIRVGRKDVIPAMLDSGRCGWYLRVLQPGWVPTSGTMTLLARDASASTIAELHRAAHHRPGPDEMAEHRQLLERGLAEPALAKSWRRMLHHRLDRL